VDVKYFRVKIILFVKMMLKNICTMKYFCTVIHNLKELKISISSLNKVSKNYIVHYFNVLFR